MTEMLGFLPWKPRAVWLRGAFIQSLSLPRFSMALLFLSLLLVYFFTLSFHSLHLLSSGGRRGEYHHIPTFSVQWPILLKV